MGDDDLRHQRLQVTNRHCNDVFCLSAGQDGTISTPFGGHNAGVFPQGTKRGGDDWATVIAPCDP